MSTTNLQDISISMESETYPTAEYCAKIKRFKIYHSVHLDRIGKGASAVMTKK